MNHKYDVVIGIEIHIELNTKTKMFSPAKNDFNDEPNTNVHPIDLGYLGTLPRPNRAAVIAGIKLAKALKMEIDHELHFDRKNYFYPDLPKGYQITQQFRPIGKNGKIELDLESYKKTVAIQRIHLEEDTAKQLHQGDFSLLDYNRAGVPLIEIVTEPVIKSAQEAMTYVDNIRKVALYLDISDAKMEEGSLRADINLSLRPFGQNKFGTKVEIKNMNSISNIAKAIDFEINLQTQRLDKNLPIEQETKRFDDVANVNRVMRQKNGELDYKYFPDPNIPVIKLDSEFIESITIPVMPWEQEAAYKTMGINQIYIESLVNNLAFATYFNQISFADKNKAANFFFAEIVSLLNSKNLDIKDLHIKPQNITEILQLIENEKISSKQAKQIVFLLAKTPNKTIKQIIDENQMQQISDDTLINKMIDDLIADNEQLVNEYPNRQEKVIKFILGNIMKLTKGNANPQKANLLVNKKLKTKFNL